MKPLRDKDRSVLLCDLDGTLVDSAADIATTLNALLKEEQRPSLAGEEIKKMVGDGIAKLVERGFSATGSCPNGDELAEKVARFGVLYEPRMTQTTRPYPGAIQVLSKLKSQGWRLAVCTNKNEAASRKMLTNLKIASLFETVTGGDSFAVKKPNPRHLLSTLDQMAATASDAVMLGDSKNDAKAAEGAGLPVILVDFGYAKEPVSEIKADKVISHYADLPKALTSL